MSVHPGEGRLRSVAENSCANKIAGIVYSQWNRVHGAGNIELRIIEVLQQITVKVAIASEVFAAGIPFVVNAAALR